tara:strand:- start:295 stop:1296 length:1002 start_codon:yes stop_codon:yes gene_type:complete
VNKNNSNFQDIKFDVDVYLRDIFNSRDMSLYNMMAYHMGYKDKTGTIISNENNQYLHAISSILVGRIFNVDEKFLYPIAASLEMFINFIGIHDDVKDGIPIRNEKDTVWWIWGPAQAINAGDGLHSLARLQISKLSEIGASNDLVFEALEKFNSASLKFSESKYLELEFQERIDVQIKEYLQLLNYRGELFSTAMSLPVLFSNSPNELIDEISNFGLNLGILIQITKDINSFWESTDVDFNFLNKKKTLPIVYAFKHASNSQKIKLGDIYFKRVLAKEDIVELKIILNEIGVRKFCELDREKFRSLVYSKLEKIFDSQESIDSLKGLIDILLV